MLRSLCTVCVLGLLALSRVHANDVDYLTISKMRVEPLEQVEVAALEQEISVEGEKSGGFAEVLAVVDGVIAVGKKIWPIVEAGKPVVTGSADRVNALPFVSGREVSAFELEGWRSPKVLAWRVTYENLYGMDVVTFTYRVRFQYGGSLDGKGAYIANATVDTSDIYVAWGYSFDGVAKMDGLANAGTRANPVAGLTLTSSFTIKTVLNESRMVRSFYLTGRGDVERLQ